MNCPSCGAGIGFRSERAPYTVCTSCQTMVVRKDIDVEAIGKIAECQPDGSAVQIGTQGSFQGRSFEVLGRIQLQYGAGFWNEWYLMYSDGRAGWLGEALGQFFLSEEMSDTSGLENFHDLRLGNEVSYQDKEWIVLDIKTVQLSSYEGELPFVMSQKGPFATIDLRNEEGEGLTVDFSDGQASVYKGHWAPYEKLSLTGLKRESDPQIAVPASQTADVKCSSCGAPHQLSAPGRTQTLVCEYCGTALDASSPELTALGAVMEKAQDVAKWSKIPMGTIAHLGDGQYKVIGMAVTATHVGGVRYAWKDYLLYNHLTGYRWLNEANGHYVLYEQLYAVPKSWDKIRRGIRWAKRPIATPEGRSLDIEGEKFQHFSTSVVTVERVVGEFYWRVQAGENSRSFDYIAPPYIVSASVGRTDITWTMGTYLSQDDMARIFPTVNLDDPPGGVAPAQPNPYAEAKKQVKKPFWIGFAAALFIVFSGLFRPGGEEVAKDQPVQVVQSKAASSLLAGRSAEFTLPGSGSKDIRFLLSSDIKDEWLKGNVWLERAGGKSAAALTRKQPVTLAKFGSKGESSQYLFLRNVPAGEPLVARFELTSGPPKGTAPIVAADEKEAQLTVPLRYSLSTLPKRSSFTPLFYYGFFIFLPIYWLKSRLNDFEKRRWYESDYG